MGLCPNFIITSRKVYRVAPSHEIHMSPCGRLISDVVITRINFYFNKPIIRALIMLLSAVLLLSLLVSLLIIPQEWDRFSVGERQKCGAAGA